jgi:hypothetical protein
MYSIVSRVAFKKLKVNWTPSEITLFHNSPNLVYFWTVQKYHKSTMEKKIEYCVSYKFWLTFFATLLGILASQFLPSLLEGSITNLPGEFLSLLHQPTLLSFVMASSFLLTCMLYWMVEKVNCSKSKMRSSLKN